MLRTSPASHYRGCSRRRVRCSSVAADAKTSLSIELAEHEHLRHGKQNEEGAFLAALADANANAAIDAADVVPFRLPGAQRLLT